MTVSVKDTHRPFEICGESKNDCSVDADSMCSEGVCNVNLMTPITDKHAAAA